MTDHQQRPGQDQGQLDHHQGDQHPSQAAEAEQDGGGQQDQRGVAQNFAILRDELKPVDDHHRFAGDHTGGVVLANPLPQRGDGIAAGEPRSEGLQDADHGRRVSPPVDRRSHGIAFQHLQQASGGGGVVDDPQAQRRTGKAHRRLHALHRSQLAGQSLDPRKAVRRHQLGIHVGGQHDFVAAEDFFQPLVGHQQGIVRGEHVLQGTIEGQLAGKGVGQQGGQEGGGQPDPPPANQCLRNPSHNPGHDNALCPPAAGRTHLDPAP